MPDQSNTWSYNFCCSFLHGMKSCTLSKSDDDTERYKITNGLRPAPSRIISDRPLFRLFLLMQQIDKLGKVSESSFCWHFVMPYSHIDQYNFFIGSSWLQGRILCPCLSFWQHPVKLVVCTFEMHMLDIIKNTTCVIWFSFVAGSRVDQCFLGAADMIVVCSCNVVDRQIHFCRYDPGTQDSAVDVPCHWRLESAWLLSDQKVVNSMPDLWIYEKDVNSTAVHCKVNVQCLQFVRLMLPCWK